MTAIKQWTTGFDGLDQLHFTTTTKPQPKDGEVLVKILAVSLNYRDTEGERDVRTGRWMNECGKHC